MKLSRATALTLIAIFCFLCIQTSTTYAQADQVTLKPTDDTYVDSHNPDSDHGNGISLYIGNWQGPSDSMIEKVWLKFSLPAIQDGSVVDSAILQLYAYSVWYETFNVNAYSCTDDSWNESTLTYSNMPNYNITPMDSKMVTTHFQKENYSQWYNWNVVDAVKNALNSDAKTLTIVLSDPSPHVLGAQAWFYSKEHSADYSPALTIHWRVNSSPTYSPSPTETTSPALSPSPSVPEFPSWTILSTVLLATLLAILLIKRKSNSPPFQIFYFP
jgi:hypothetical protein